MESISVYIEQSESTSILERRIREAIHAVLPLAVEAIQARDINIEVNFDKELTIPETGVGGSTESPHLIVVSVDPTHTNVLKSIEAEIKSTLVHELHHAMRNRYYPWPGTLLDDIVGEGLADHFDIEINQRGPKPWSIALTDNELETYYKMVDPLLYEQNTVDGYYKWVLGTADDAIPRWAGYALGFKLVGDYLLKTSKKPSELVAVPSVEFV